MTTERFQYIEEDAAQQELRGRHRYPLHMPLSGQVLGHRPVPIAGQTVNMSSQGVLFTTSEPIPDRARVRLQVDWPVRTEDGEPLELTLSATVVWSRSNVVAARIWGHAFHVISAAASIER